MLQRLPLLFVANCFAYLLPACAGAPAVASASTSELAPRATLAEPVPVAPSPPSAPTVTLATRSESYASPAFDVQARYARVSGMRDPAAEKKANDALMAPVNLRIASVRRGLVEFGQGEGAAPVDVIAATLTLSTSNLVSVRYAPVINTVLTHSTWAHELTVSVDLNSGQVLGLREIFRAEVLTSSGFDALGARILAQAPHDLEWCFSSGTYPPIKLSEASFVATASRGNLYPVPAIQLSLTPRGIAFLIDLADYERPFACGQPAVLVPFAELRTFLRPELLALLKSS